VSEASGREIVLLFCVFAQRRKGAKVGCRRSLLREKWGTANRLLNSHSLLGKFDDSRDIAEVFVF